MLRLEHIFVTSNASAGFIDPVLRVRGMRWRLPIGRIAGFVEKDSP